MASIYQSRNGWTAQVNKGGKRVSKAFRTKTEAQRWARHQEVKVDEGKRLGGTRLTYAELQAAYVEEIQHKASRSKLNALAIISSYLGRRPLNDMDVDTFIKFAKARAAEGAGPATINMDLSYVGTVMKYGGVLLDVPTETAAASLQKARLVLGASGIIGRSKERDRRPTDDELVMLRDFWAKRRRGIPMWVLTQFAVATAMRLGEITRLEWDDLNRDDKTILIRDRKHPRLKLGNHKTVPLLCGPVVIDGEEIDPMALIERQPVEDGEARIFPYDPSTVSTMFTRAVASCGIDDLRFHDLRHDGISRLFEADYRIEQVALISGHEDWKQLKRYTNLRAADLHRK